MEGVLDFFYGGKLFVVKDQMIGFTCWFQLFIGLLVKFKNTLPFSSFSVYTYGSYRRGSV